MPTSTTPTGEDQRIVGARLRLLREAYGLSQDDIATVCGTSQAAVSKWESGRSIPRRVHQVAIADRLEVDRRTIFNEVM